MASFFHINHGGNVVIENQGNLFSIYIYIHSNYNVRLIVCVFSGIGVRRLNGYNRAIVIASKPIIRGQCFKVFKNTIHFMYYDSLKVILQVSSNKNISVSSNKN